MANEVLYTTTLNDTLRLEQHFIEQPGKQLSWQTILYNTKKNDSLILENIRDYRPPFPDDAAKDRGHYLKICGAVLYDQTIYAIYQNYGYISLKYYRFSGPREFRKNETPINRVVTTGIWGPPKGFATFSRVNDQLFFYLGLSHIVMPNLFSFDMKTGQISKIIFSDKMSPGELHVLSTRENLFEKTNLTSETDFIADHLRPMLRNNIEFTNVLSFTYLGFLEDTKEFAQQRLRYVSKIYFFSSVDQKLQITRYSSYHKEWLIAPFVEEPLIFDPAHTGILK
ncbi:hypothetical protein OQY15_00865 [Pedobacter sp. MC2016-15]|uniref:hypothetical protein n=1 Tax=Pedobacter sp. MC2016-15 TaxID=2994473 RepID=UPI0022471457|nr:hypothetical protein [Pedobacter sp. MC2016-15]MCX2477618.1 hypothetical protein [Pedobacter sp. MC2016-15]